MRAIMLRTLGGPENLRLETVQDPTADDGEVVVKLRAAALNHRDVWIRKGQYAGIKLPVILGSDGAGEVAATGPNVDSGWIGKSVVINPGFDWGSDSRCFGPNFRILGLPDDGTYAEFVKVPATNIYAMPADWSWPEAAALPLAGLTAYRAVVSRANVHPEVDTVLVTGIGGGVSLFALQIAKAMGARVFVTSSSDEKLARAQSLGAAGGVNYQSDDWVKQLAAMSGGIDVVIDSAGGPTLNSAIELCKPGGRIVTYGATTGLTPKLDVRRLFWKQLNVLGSTMGSPVEFARMLELYHAHKLKPVVDRTMPLAEAAAAHQRMEQAGQFGKIVLDMG